MNRRDALPAVLATLIASTGASPFPALGQTRIRRIVAITGNSEQSVDQSMRSFREELKALGYQEGRDISFEIGYAEFSRERGARLAADAVASKPDVIFAMHGAVHAFAALTKTIPIVAIYSGDLVEAGLVKSLARPGGNITGCQLLDFELVGKRIEILKEIVPSIKRLAVIAFPAHPGLAQERDASITAAKQLGVSVAFYPVRNPQELDAGLDAAQAAGTDGLVLFPDPVTLSGAERIAAFALKHKLPVVGGWHNYADAGALLSYGPNLREVWRRAAHHLDRVLKGVNPLDIPVELPTLYEAVVNLKTARALGLKVPYAVLLRANRLIE